MGHSRPLVVAIVLAGLAALALPAAAPAACTGVPKKSCLLPFPNDFSQTKKDKTTPTGRRVNLSTNAMPRTKSGKRLDVREWNRNDGFSPGQPILVHVPTLKTQTNFTKSGIVPVNDLAQYTRKSQPLLLLDEKTGKRQIVWGELDAFADVPAKSRNLIIHPAKNLVPGRRYVVVLRGLKGLHAPAGLKKTWSDALKTALDKAKVKSSTVYLAWDFTVGSDKSLTSRLLAIRDDAFRQLGDTNLADGKIAGHPPGFTVTSVTDFTPAENAKIARKVVGTFTVPCYLSQPGCPPGSRFHYSSSKKDALPSQTPGNVDVADFQCNIPRAASAGQPSKIALYGHGLLGSHTQIDETNIQDMSAEHDFTFCATDWQGMSANDVPNAIKVLQDMSGFPTLVDRLQQGILNTLYLGRLLAHPQGLAANPAFQGPGGQALLDTSNLYYDSNSQGAILGGVTTAVAPDWQRAVFGVATMDFGLLLPRSIDFDQYSFFMAQSYPDEGMRQELISLAQVLWDRGETDGWAHRATSKPPKNAPTHTVLMHVAVGDPQVTNVASDVEARSIGARAYQPAIAAGRSLDKTPLFGIPKITSFPFRGSAIVYWDGGPQTAPTPAVNLPNRGVVDSHYFPRQTKAARQQKADFLVNGVVNDVCGGQPCRADQYG
jgi:hypothetical protein